MEKQSRMSRTGVAMVACLLIWGARVAADDPLASARRLKQAGKLAQAEQVLAAVVRAEPANAEAQYLLAWVLVGQGRRVDAVAPFQTVVRLTPASAEGAEARAALARLGAPTAAAPEPAGPRVAEERDGPPPPNISLPPGPAPASTGEPAALPPTTMQAAAQSRPSSDSTLGPQPTQPPSKAAVAAWWAGILAAWGLLCLLVWVSGWTVDQTGPWTRDAQLGRTRRRLLVVAVLRMARALTWWRSRRAPDVWASRRGVVLQRRSDPEPAPRSGQDNAPERAIWVESGYGLVPQDRLEELLRLLASSAPIPQEAPSVLGRSIHWWDVESRLARGGTRWLNDSHYRKWADRYAAFEFLGVPACSYCLGLGSAKWSYTVESGSTGPGFHRTGTTLQRNKSWVCPSCRGSGRADQRGCKHCCGWCKDRLGLDCAWCHGYGYLMRG